MSDTIFYRVFLTCLMVCTGMVLVAIWIGEHVLPPVYFQSAASIFVIGLASFLLWFSRTLLALKAK